jgi:Tfp pilus assembly protein PilF
MMRFQFTEHRFILLIMGMACSPGCVHLEQTAPTPARSPVITEPTPKLSSQQAAEVHVGLGRSLEKRGDLNQATAAYLEAQKRDPGCLDACLRLAVVYDRQGKFQDSAVQYGKALKLAPKNPDVYCDLGYSLYLQKRWPEAESNLRRAISLKADHSRAHNNLGLVLARTNRLDDAAAQFREGGCKPADAYVNVAFALTLDRQWEAAKLQYQHALAIDSTSQPAHDGLRNLEKLRQSMESQSNHRSAGITEPVQATASRPVEAAPTR